MAKKQDTQLSALVERFVADLTVAIHQEAMDAVREALGEGAAPKKRGPGRPKKAARKRGPGRPRKTTAKRGPGRPRKTTSKRGRRSAEDVAALGGMILAHIAASPGQRLEEIGRDLGIATKELKRPISNLMDAGSLRTEGQKRGTKYFAGKGGKRKAKKTPKKKA